MLMIGGDSLLVSVPTLIHILSCPHKKWPAMFTQWHKISSNIIWKGKIVGIHTKCYYIVGIYPLWETAIAKLAACISIFIKIHCSSPLNSITLNHAKESHVTPKSQESKDFAPPMNLLYILLYIIKHKVFHCSIFW